MLNQLPKKCSARSSHAKRSTCFPVRGVAISCLAALLLTGLLYNVSAPAKERSRPRILGIAYVKIQVSHLDKAAEFYSAVLQTAPPTRMAEVAQQPCIWCEQGPIGRQRKAKKHFGPIQLGVFRDPNAANRLEEIAFRTNDVKKLRDFLLAKNLSPGQLFKCGEDTCFQLLDPEKHRLVFVSAKTHPPIIHAGFVVRDRVAEDYFYKDILGFHVYWHGGMKEGEDNWVDMQVPDGTDWIEYMLKVPENATHKQLGVMNHIALGVPDIHAAQAQLIKNGWKGTEEPKIGRDGKWQLNLYDPDETRVELMEFKPTKDPCCSSYTGPHPGPAQ